jgi:hypothetical protein
MVMMMLAHPMGAARAAELVLPEGPYAYAMADQDLCDELHPFRRERKPTPVDVGRDRGRLPLMTACANKASDWFPNGSTVRLNGASRR